MQHAQLHVDGSNLIQTTLETFFVFLPVSLDGSNLIQMTLETFFFLPEVKR